MDNRTAGERLRIARRQAGLSAEELGRRAAQILGRNRPISASAVRNQENGTNGIPIDTAQAYAEILGVTPGHIIWGNPGPDADASASTEPGDARELELWDELAIPALRVISARWLPLIMDTGVPSSQDHIIVGLPGWHAAGANLQALQVMDRSLEPIFRKGSYLVCAPVDEATVFNGSYVLASWLRGGEIVHSIRRAYQDEQSVYLKPATDDIAEPEAAVQVIENIDGKDTWVGGGHYWIDGVVLASLHIETATGRPIDIVPHLDDVPAPDEPKPSIGDLRRALHDEAWPARDLDFVGVRLRQSPRRRDRE